MAQDDRGGRPHASLEALEDIIPTYGFRT